MGTLLLADYSFYELYPRPVMARYEWRKVTLHHAQASWLLIVLCFPRRNPPVNDNTVGA